MTARTVVIPGDVPAVLSGLSRDAVVDVTALATAFCA